MSPSTLATPPISRVAPISNTENVLSFEKLTLTLFSLTTISSSIACPVLFILRKISAPALTVPASKSSFPETVPATPPPRIIRAPLPLIIFPLLPPSSTTELTFETPSLVTSPLCSNAKSPYNSAAKPAARDKFAPSTFSLTYGPASRVTLSIPLPKL